MIIHFPLHNIKCHRVFPLCQHDMALFETSANKATLKINNSAS